MDELIAQLYVYIKGTWKYRWLSIILAWIIAIGGWVVVYKLPDNYKASARIYVDTQNILRPLMAGMTVSPNAQQQVSIMSRTLINRPNIERIVRMVDLDITISDETERENLVTNLMSDIRLNAAAGDNIFTISINNENPTLAKDIVQSLLTIFVEEGLEGKRDDSSSALRFINQQVATYEAKLIAAENALTAFKQENIGLLPGQQGGDYFTQMLRTKENLRTSELELREAKQAQDAIKRRISGDKSGSNLESNNEPEIIADLVIDSRINELKDNLDNLRLNFTDQHPDIVSTMRLIDKLEKRKKEEAKSIYPIGDPGRNYSPMLQQLNVALAESEAVVASMQARVEEYTTRHENLKSLSIAIPKVESAFTQLNRDYNINKANYEQLLNRRISAQMSGELTSASGLLSFRIIDPPTVPDQPDGPNRSLLYSIVLLASLGIGIAAAFITSQIRPACYSQSNLREVSGLTVLGTVPMIWTKNEQIKKKRRLYAFGFSLLCLAGTYTFLMFFYEKIDSALSSLPF